MRYYADTGFLLSLHLPEATSAAAAALMMAVSEPLPVTPLVELEFRNALRLAVFRKTITEIERAKAWASFQQDGVSNLLESTPADEKAVYAEAVSLCELFTASVGVRTLDMLHVANARILGRSDFLSFDKRQRALATAAGLNVYP